MSAPLAWSAVGGQIGLTPEAGGPASRLNHGLTTEVAGAVRPSRGSIQRAFSGTRVMPFVAGSKPGGKRVFRSNWAPSKFVPRRLAPWKSAP